MPNSQPSILNPQLNIPSPCFVIEESPLRRNLALIKNTEREAGVTIILAFKAFAQWKTFPIIKEYIRLSTASSVNEARLAYEEMGSPAHTYAPVYTDADFPQILKYSSHITFNSLAQFHRFQPAVQASGKTVSCGLRINPEYSLVETNLYNPCAPGSRLGITADTLKREGGLPPGVEGLHFHTLCESSPYDLEKTLEAVEQKFNRYFSRIKWLNMGGGHLMTRADYKVSHLIDTLRLFRFKYPNLEIILEPGSAFAWQTGYLLATIEDIVESDGISTAIIDASFACHMPDCLEMPYKPTIRGSVSPSPDTFSYRIGGNSCLSGDWTGEWSFPSPLKVGQHIIFEDMIHYTIVKTTMFNGVAHPSIAFLNSDNELIIHRNFGYEDYKNRMG